MAVGKAVMVRVVAVEVVINGDGSEGGDGQTPPGQGENGAGRHLTASSLAMVVMAVWALTLYGDL